MGIKDKVQIAPLTSGDEFKVLAVMGEKNTEMPLHKATGEAVIVVRRGTVRLNIEESEKTLNEGGVYIIPAGKPHSLKVEKDFEATVLMSANSGMVFDNK